MPTLSKKMDLNQLAKSIVDQATGEVPKVLHGEQLTGKQAAGRKGGLSGGKKRMESLTPEQRKELSAKATQARLEKEAPASKEASANANQLNKVN
jgi:hypothetical protein